MGDFVVTVEGKEYDVTAPDERTAWRWANATHNKAPSKPGGKFPVDITPAMPSGAELLAANPVTRGVVGSASPFLGLMQLGARNPISKALGQDKWIDDKLSRLKEMEKAGGHEGMDVAGLAGALASPAALAALKIPLASTMAGKAGQGAAIGAGFGAAAPVTEGEFASEKGKQIGTGAAVGGVLPAAISGVSKGAGVVRNIVDPWLPGGIDRIVGRTANAAAGPDRGAIIQALTQNRQLVPGSAPTAGEAAAHVGRAEFSGLQRVVSGRQPTAYDRAGDAQESARRSAIGTIAKDEPTLAAAITTRSKDASQNYSAAYARAIRADPELAKLSQNPYFKDALPDAMKLAEAKGIDPKTDLTQFLHFVKLSLDKQLSRRGDTALSNTEQQTVTGLQSRLVDWMRRKNPEYDHARAEFAAASKPINQMEVGRELQKTLTNSLETAERPAAFAAAVENAPRTIKKATGNPRFDSLDEVLTSPQNKVVNAVLDDLKRSAEHDRLGKAGTERARRLIGDIDPMRLPNALHRPVMVINAILNRVQGKVQGKSLEALSEKMRDPQEMARLMQMSPPQRRAVIEALVQQMGRAGAIGAAQGVSP